MTVYSAAQLVDYSLVYDPEISDFLIYCCTTDGKLYKLNQLELEQKLGSNVNSSEEDVFSDLLEEDGIELSLSTEPVYQLQSCDLVYDFKTAVCGLCVACGLVAVITRAQSRFSVQIYQEKDFCEVVDAAVTPFQVLELDLHIGQFKNDLEKILTKFLISEEIISTDTQSSDCLNVPVGLYKALVGQDVCLLSSPVILVAPPGGSLYFAPIKTLDSSRPMRSVITDQTSNSRFKLLCETTSDVILLDIMKIKIAEARTTKFSEMLLVCSQNGLVHLMGIHHKDKNVSSGLPQTWSASVDGPILCACCFNNRLYHSTGRYICETTVSFTVQSAKGEKLVPQTEVRRFQLPGVEHIAAYVPKGIIETDDTPCMLHCSHLNGRTTRLNTAEHFKDLKSNKGVNFATTMKETLFGIESIDRKKEEIDKDLALFEILLKQINIAATMYHHYMTSLDKCSGYDMSAKDRTVPVKCMVKARFPDGENVNKIMLDCEITNQMPCSLSCDWSVMITIEPTNSNEDCISRSFKLDKDFRIGKSFIISIPINPKLILAGMKATVFFILQLSFQGNEAVSLCIPVHMQSVDVLYFLYSEDIESRSINITSLQSSLLHQELLKIARTKPAYSILRDNMSGKEQSSVCVSVTVCLKHDNTTRMCVNPSDPCSILCFLLQNCAVLKKPVSDNGCYQTFLGAPVYLSVGMNQSNEGRETTLVTVSIRADIATAAAVHRAINDRLLMLSRETNIQKLQTETLKHKLTDMQELEDELARLQTDRRCQDINTLATVYEKLRKIATLQ